MKREKIDDKFKWNDNDLYLNFEAFDADCERIKLLLRKLKGFKNKLNNDIDILKFFNLKNDLDRKLERIIIYAYIRKSVEGADAKNIELNQIAQDISIKVSESLSFAEEEIAKLEDSKLIELSNNIEFSQFKRDLEFMIKNKPHVQTEEVEKIVSRAGAFADFEDTFSALSNIEMPIADVVSNGKKIPLNNSNYSKFMRSCDRDIRKQAYNNYYKAYNSFNITYSNLYIDSLKYSNFLVKTYNFKSNFERVNFYEEVPEKLVNIMLKCVHKGLPILNNYFSLKRSELKLDSLKYYDFLAPLSNTQEPKYPYNKAIKAILNSLSVIGDDYIDLVRHALSSRWIDLYPTKNKESCSYCVSCYDVHPYILTNFNNSLDATSTLSHELGHAMQAYLASKVQPYNLAECPSLTCEIASTVNEILTKKYIIDNATDKNEKLLAIDSLLIDFYAAIFSQSLYTEFETFASGQIERGETLSFDKLNCKYKELIEKYFGKDVSNTQYCECGWSRLPHFYSPFYVYKYVVGFVSACTICGKLLPGDRNYKSKYMAFLKAGNSRSPLELLKLAEVDLLDEQTYFSAFKLFELYIDELKELLEEKD